jgi:hypothetical protein
MTGTLGCHKLGGRLDLGMVLKNKVFITDYKTTQNKPNPADFPIRQFSIYVHMLEQHGIPVSGLSTIYLVKSEPPKNPKKAKGPHEYAHAHYFNLEKNREIYERNLKLLEEDMDQIKRCLEHGIFLRNRRSMFCPCEAAEYCENPKNVEAYMSKRRVPTT